MPMTKADLTADAAELRELARRCLRPKVKAMLEAEVERLEAELNAHEAMSMSTPKAATTPAPATATARLPTSPASETVGGAGLFKPVAPKAAAPAPAPTAPAPAPAPKAAAAPPPAPVRLPNEAGNSADRVQWTTIPSFGWDQDEYGKDPQNVYVHLLSGMDGIGQLKERVSEPAQSREVAPASAPAGGSAAMPEQAGGPSHRAPCVRRCAQRATSRAAPST
jgi:uncharacterized small protein (DUF1192 family)